MATLTASSAELTALLKSDPKPHSAGAEAAINIAFIALTTLSHCLGVKVSCALEQRRTWLTLYQLYGKIERVRHLEQNSTRGGSNPVAFYKFTIKLEAYISLWGVYLLRFSNVYAVICDTDSGHPGDLSR